MSAREGRSATISLLVSSHSGRNAKPPEITDRSGDYTHEREARLEQDVDTVVAGIREHRKKKPCPSSLIADPDGHMVLHAARDLPTARKDPHAPDRQSVSPPGALGDVLKPAPDFPGLPAGRSPACRRPSPTRPFPPSPAGKLSR